jgi:hypothetical protein
MDKKLSINVNVTDKRSQSEAAGIPMIASHMLIPSLDELKESIDYLLDCKDCEITVAINVDATDTRSLSEAAGIPMIDSDKPISSLDELKKLIDYLLDCKDSEITGAINIKGSLNANGATPNTAVQPTTVH